MLQRQEEAGKVASAPPFADFASFRERIREEDEATRAELEAAEARVEGETATVEQRCLMAEGFELRLQLAQGSGRQSGVAGGELWIAGSRAVQSKALCIAALLLEATAPPTQVSQRLGLTAGSRLSRKRVYRTLGAVTEFSKLCTFASLNEQQRRRQRSFSDSKRK